MGLVAQVRGFASNAWAYVSDFALDDVLLPSITEAVNWAIGLVPDAFGLQGATPKEQIDANIIFIIFWATLSIASLGTTLVLAAFHMMLLSIGVWRWLPAFNEMWTRFRDWLPIKSDYDIPFWRSN